MPPSLPLHRHQSSLEGVIYFSAEPTLGTDQRTNAKRRFYRIVEYFEAASSSNGDYSRPRLVHLTYDYALSEESRDNFLRAFFRAMALSINGSEEDVDAEDLRTPFFGFADYLLDNFFLPLKASTKRTPQPSPAFHSAVQRVQGGDADAFAGTPDRVSALRGACLIRDRHRCVISRKFDLEEGAKRMQKDGDNARDDDGGLLLEDANPVDVLEVAHILPHSLMKADIGSELNPSKQAALAILNMFDSGVVHLVEGVEIDRPRNAITLTHTLHRLFGDFRLFFEPIADRQPHTYRISSFYPPTLLRDPAFPITRALYLTDSRTIDPPSPQLLAVHSAIAHILHLSAAGDYIDKLLRDMDGKGIQTDGSTELDRLVKLRLGGWLDGPIYS